MSAQSDHARDLADILHGAAAVFGGFLSRTGTRFAFLFVAGNLYGAAALGELAFFLAIVETMAAIAVFGLKKSLFGFFDQDEPDADQVARVVLNALVFSTGLALIFAALLAFIAWPWLGLPAGACYLPFFAFIIPVIVLSDILLTATRIRRVMRYLVFARSIAEPAALLLFTLLFFFTDLRDQGLILAYAGSMLVAVTISFYGYGRLYSYQALMTATVNFRTIKHIARISLPTTLADMGSLLIRRIDVFFLWHFTSDGIVGTYYAIQNIASNIQKTRQLFSPVLAPVVAQSMARQSMASVASRLRLVSRWILTLQLAQLILLSLFAAPLLALVGTGMEVGAVALMIMLSGEVFEGTFGLLDLPLIFRRPSINAWLVAGGSLLMAVLCYFLIPRYGLNGAAMSLAVVLVLINSGRIFILARFFGMAALEWSCLKPVTAAATAILALLSIRYFAPFDSTVLLAAGLFVTILVYGGVLFLLGINQEDKELYHTLRKKKS